MYLSVRTLPNIAELAKGKFSRSDLRELDIDDSLGYASSGGVVARVHLKQNIKVANAC
jgi:FlaA1/EpsC-like NDP-sugar epimerase